MMEQLLVESMKRAIATNANFVLETPLSHADYWLYIDMFKRAGYQIQLNYLCLDKVSDCIARVGQRVLEGGHYVDPKTIKGVYDKNLEHINDYHDSFSVIELYDGMKIPTLLAKMEDGKVIFCRKMALQKKWVKAGCLLCLRRSEWLLKIRTEIKSGNENATAAQHERLFYLCRFSKLALHPRYHFQRFTDHIIYRCIAIAAEGFAYTVGNGCAYRQALVAQYLAQSIDG